MRRPVVLVLRVMMMVVVVMVVTIKVAVQSFIVHQIPMYHTDLLLLLLLLLKVRTAIVTNITRGAHYTTPRGRR